MPDTKKLLVAFDPAKSDSRSSDFVVPWYVAKGLVLRGLKSGKTHTWGMMVYLGRTVSENDLFARLVDSGAIIPDVDRTLGLLREYVRQLQGLRIGDVVEVVRADEADRGFELRVNRKLAHRKGDAVL